MARRITASIGLGGVNRKDDSMTVQDLLNKVPADQGGPRSKALAFGAAASCGFRKRLT
jgi:hypothetical protein